MVHGLHSYLTKMPFKKVFLIKIRPTIVDIAESVLDGNSPIDSTNSEIVLYCKRLNFTKMYI